ncbi:MAG: hypothetical protein HS126_37250 [Anaerolineales bacterium]|nr:hypothetical protein [Anaerolineales bacterium]
MGRSISSVAFSPNGRYIVSAGSYPDSTVRVWDVFSGKMIASMEHDDGGGSVTSIAFSPDGHYIVSAAEWADTIRVWEVSSGRGIYPHGT